MEINPHFSFPAASPSHLQPINANSRPRPKSFNSPSRPGKSHAHRRSAAVSEDLSNTDFTAILERAKLGSSGSSLRPPASIRPTSLNSLTLAHENNSSSSLSSGASSFMRKPRVSFQDCSSPRRAPIDLHVHTDNPTISLGPPISYGTSGFESPKSMRSSSEWDSHSISHTNNYLGTPGGTERTYGSPRSSSPVTADNSRKMRRRSFVNYLRHKIGSPSKRSSVGASAIVIEPRKSDAMAIDIDIDPEMPLHTPPQQRASPVKSIPIMENFYEQPSIDLNEAKGCYLPSHRRSESLPMSLEPSFNKRRSQIHTVAEADEDEEHEMDDQDQDRTIVARTSQKNASPLTSIANLAILDPPASASRPTHSHTHSHTSYQKQGQLMEPLFDNSPSKSPVRQSTFDMGDYDAMHDPQTSQSHRRRRSLAGFFSPSR